MTSAATIKLNLETKDFATKANDASISLLGLQLAAGGAGLAFRGLGAASRSGIAEIGLGAVAVDKLNTNLGKAAASSGKLSGIFGELSGLATNIAIVTTTVVGLTEAVSQFNRIPQTLATISASGVNTQTITEFQQMEEAIGGNQIAVEGFVNTAIARLGEFEQAAARSATILRSNTRFDDSGNALRVNQAETLANALSIQNLVTTKLDNAVTSSSALLAQYEVLSAGFSKQADSEKVLETALKLTQIGQAGGVASNAGDNAKLVGKSLQAYNLGAGDAARTGAILNEVVAQGITTIPELSNGFGAAGSSAAKAGISMSALGAGVAQLTSLGQDTSEALTGLKGLSDAIINKTPEAAAELAKLSLNGQRIRFDIAEVQAKGLVQALLDVNKAAGNSPQILAKIFPDAVTSRAVTGLISGGGEGFKARFEAINSATGQGLDDVAKLASDTRVNRMEKLANKFGEIVISIAQSVAPVVEPGLNALKQIADGFASIPDPVKQAIGSWLAAQITMQSATAGLGALAKTLGDLAGLYVTARLLNLAFSGQLGSELTVIKELVVQRKGLASVLLQTIGINQRYRLGVDAASAALQNQGIVAKGAYAAQAKGAEVATAASNKFKDIFAQNMAGARAAANEFGSSPAAGKAVNGVVGIRGRVEGVAAAVANSQTGQNARNAIGGFLDRNPYIGTAATELKGATQNAIDRVKSEAAKFAQSDTYNNIVAAASGATTAVQTNAARAGKIGADIVDTARTSIADPGASDRARLQQLIDAELQLKQPKLVQARSQLEAKLADLETQTAFKQWLNDSKRDELVRKQYSFSQRAEKLEDRKDKLSPEAYTKAQTKLNKDAAKIQDLNADIQANALPLAELQRERAKIGRELNSVTSNLARSNIEAQGKFTPLVNLESRLNRVNAAAQKATATSNIAESYANNVNKIAPGTAQAAAASEAAYLAGVKQTSLAGRAQKLESQYQELLTSTGARTALLAQQGLASVKFGGRDAIYSTNSKLESLLYADVGKAATKAFDFAKTIATTGLSTSLGFLSVQATRAGMALSSLSQGGFIKGIGNAIGDLKGSLTSLPSRIAASYAQGGIKGVVGGGFNSLINAPGALATRALPFLPAAITTAVAPLAAAAATAAVVFRDDFARNKLASEFSQSVDETLAKDRQLKSKLEGRSRPLSELKSAVENLSQDKAVGNFTARQALVPTSQTERGAFGTIVSAPEGALNAIVGTGGRLGKAADNLVKPSFNLEGASTLATIDPVRAQLKSLADAGELTVEQFKDLDSTLAQMGKSGKVSAEELAKFTAKLDGIKGQDKPQSRGVVDAIGNAIYMAPGQVARSTLNTAGSIVDTGANLVGSLLSGSLDLGKTARNREADALISYIGDNGSLSKLNRATLDANLDSRKDLASYRNGIALDTKNQGILASGKTLSQSDVAREKLITDARIESNKILTANYDKDIKNLEEQLEKQKDAGNKSALQSQITAYKTQKEALDKNTETLKASSEAFAKYNLETLPGLVRALKESSDPTKAVGLAGEDFNNIYQKDSEGKDTKLTKDIAKLREDSQKYVEALVTKYSIDNSAGAESEAVAGLKSARDNRITLSTGDSGFRETIAQRQALTDQIVKIQSAGTQKIIAAKTLEAEKLKVLTTNGSIATQDAAVKSQEVSIDIARENLAAKEREIQEYSQFPRKVVELEQQAATLRVQLEQQVADQQKAIRDRAFSLRQAEFDLQAEQLKTMQAQQLVGGVDAIGKSSDIELAKSRDALEKLYQDRGKLTQDSPELNNQIGTAEQRYAQQQANANTQIFEGEIALQKQLIGLQSQKDAQPLNIQNKQIEAAQKVGELQSSILSINRELLNSSLDIQQSQLANEGKLANSSVKRSELELTSTRAKLASLDQTQAYERESLILQQKLTQLSLTAQQNQLKISQIEQQRTIKELELQQLKLDRDKSNSPESQAAKEENKIAIQNAKIQLATLDSQAQVLDKQGQANKQITEAKLKQNIATAANAKETERINLILAEVNLKQSRITETTERQNLAYTSQTQALTAKTNAIEIQTKQLENQSKILTTQQGLISATADGRIGELNVMGNLTTIESVKLSIAQRVATLKLASLTSQLGLEKDILELNLQQQQATLAQDKIKQEISVTQGQADILGARSNLEKLRVDPRSSAIEIERAKLELQAKEQQLALTQSQGKLLEQQAQIVNYQAYAQRTQLDITQRGKLQSGLADVASTQPETQGANLGNAIFNAGVREEGTQYYKNLAESVVGEAKKSPLVLPQFSSPYDNRSNYNRPGAIDPTKIAPVGDVNYRSGAGSLDLSPQKTPSIQPVDTSGYQADARARYAEFTARQSIDLSTTTRQVQQQQQERRQERESGGGVAAPVKPVTVNLQMTNDIKISVASATETKDTITSSTLSSLETVLRLVKDKY